MSSQRPPRAAPAFATPAPLRTKPSHTQREARRRTRSTTAASLRGEMTRRAALRLAVGGGAAYDVWADRYEKLDGRTPVTALLGLTEARENTLQRAHGDVLELGVGTGVNLPLYTRDNLSSLTAADASAAMLAEAEGRARAARAHLVRADAAALPFDDAMFDTVVDTFSLCTFKDPYAALCEMHRVLRPVRASRLLLVEHTASDFAPLRAYQDAVAPAVATLSKGCVWNQRVEEMAKDARFFTVQRSTLLAGTVLVLEMAPVAD